MILFNKKVAPELLSRVGTILIWLGVLTWLPFIVLHVAGQNPSLFWFLPFHLLGVIGGARLRAIARTAPSPKKNWRRLVAHFLILAGVLVWVPYFYIKLVMHQNVEVTHYLPFHLLGIFGGIVLHSMEYFSRREGKRE